MNTMMVWLFFFLVMPLISYSAITATDCLDCHGQYKGYIHGGISCIECHKDISMIPHEERLEKPQCITCHNKTVKAYGLSIHARRRVPCAACHNIHFVDREKKECLVCHQNITHRTLPSSKKHIDALPCLACHGKVKGGAIEVAITVKKAGVINPEIIDRDRNKTIDKLEWDSLLFELSEKLRDNHTIHKEYRIEGDIHSVTEKPAGCNSCHEDRGLFSKAHLRVSGAISYESPMNPRIFIPPLPSIEDYKRTVHGKRRIQCNACHTSQKSVDDNTCTGCHKDLYEVYKGTPHAKRGATQCTNCHNPHKVKTYRELSTSERVAICASCHKNYLKAHQWLPNTYLHFKYLECSTCHSPYSEKSIVFYMKTHEKEGLTPLSYQSLSSIFKTKGAIKYFVDKDENGVVDARELNEFFNKLKKSLQENITIDASLVVTRIHHDHAKKGNRKSVCKECHSGSAPFYNSMYLALPDKDMLIYLPVKGTSLSMLPIALFVDVLLLGETKITREDLRGLLFRGDRWYQHVRMLGYKWIDIICITALCVVICGVIIHIMARIFLAKR